MDRSILNQSTTADFEPVSGFALTSICGMLNAPSNSTKSLGMTHEGPSVCKQLEEYLLSKLGKDHAGVKLKVLRILKYVCENGGSIEFRRLIQRRSDIIRQCQSYRGATDPLRGDAPNKEVRDEAQNVMRALFASENSAVSTPNVHGPGSVRSSRIQSVSSGDFGGYSAPSTFTNSSPAPPSSSQSQYGGRPMASMGNPNFDNYGSAPKSSSMSFASLMTSENPGRDIISAVTSGVQSVAETLAKTAQPYMSKESSTMTSRGHYSSSAFPPTYDYQPNRPTWTPPQVVQQQAARYSAEQTSSDIPSSDSSVSRSLVNELCNSNSARTNPTQQSLDVFVRKAENLDGSVLGPILASKLADAQVPWVHKIKILSGIEAVHASGLDLVISSFLENGGASALIALLNSVQCGTKARHVAGLLGLLGDRQQPTVKPPTNEQLINFDDDLVPTEKTLVQAISPSVSNDLLVFDESPITTPQTSLI